MKRNLFIMGVLSMLLAACSNQEEITDPHFMWSGNKYITTYEPVEEERLAERVGVIKAEVDGPIDENGEAMGLPEDTPLYNIDDQKESTADLLAYQVGNRFYTSRKLVVHH
ncbi:hypothetical protein [Rossellomorea aquimaris]|jgi:hypothetical protein|uniref:hypothetical protein n=1 Tax=Rossellomorea aquimaris TaxID=189382 RepID=UPI0011E96F4B|nr:hypothetical protein [Rossellomorea aquimaris]TYS89771.1 hypothetical protein FZC88_09230 [Rossellomorea aquimaris]